MAMQERLASIRAGETEELLEEAPMFNATGSAESPQRANSCSATQAGRHAKTAAAARRWSDRYTR